VVIFSYNKNWLAVGCDILRWLALICFGKQQKNQRKAPQHIATLKYILALMEAVYYLKQEIDAIIARSVACVMHVPVYIKLNKDKDQLEFALGEF
jgi:hypothetical protein